MKREHRRLLRFGRTGASWLWGEEEWCSSSAVGYFFLHVAERVAEDAEAVLEFQRAEFAFLDLFLHRVFLHKSGGQLFIFFVNFFLKSRCVLSRIAKQVFPLLQKVLAVGYALAQDRISFVSAL